MAFSCQEENTLVDNETPKIIALSRQSTFLYDTVSVYGMALGNGIENIKVLINGSESDVILLSNNSTELKFVPKQSVSNANISLNINGKITNSIPINIALTPAYDTVNVTAGTFEMGALSGFADETPIHEVKLTRDIIVFKNEVSRALWNQVMDTVIVDNSEFEFPQDSVTWLMAVSFCNRMSVIYGLDKSYKIDGTNVTFDYGANGWRLPTEAEWEYICRAGTEEDFSGNGNIDDMGYFDSNSGLQSHRSGEKLANQFGLYDVHGNLWEWCWDNYDEGYYDSSPKEDPTGPSIGGRHVMRGGSFQDGFNFARSSNRSINKIDYKAIGLRIVRNAK